MKFELDNIQKEEIRNLHKMCKDRRYADKLKSLLLLDKGFSCEDVGEMLLLDDDTIRIYRTEYLSSGAKKLIQNNQKGRVSYLTDEQLKELETHLEIHTYADSKGISVWIKDEFNVEYSANGLTHT